MSYFNGDERMGRYLHVGVTDAHSAEDGEGLDKVFIVLCEGQVIEFVDQLQEGMQTNKQTNRQTKRIKRYYMQTSSKNY